MRRLITLLCVFALTFTIACDDDAADDAPDQDDETEEVEEDDDDEAAEVEEEAEPLEFAEYDLGEGDDSWEGWTIEGVEGLNVMGDLSGPRLTQDGFDVWDLLVSFDHRDLEEIKETQKGHAEDNDELTVEIVEDEEDVLVWTRQYGEGGSTTWNFIRLLTVDDTEVTCQTNLQNGASSEELFQQQLDACDTVSAPAGEEEVAEE